MTPSDSENIATIGHNFWWIYKKSMQNQRNIWTSNEKIRTAEEIYNFHINNEDTEMAHGVSDLGFVINSKGHCSSQKVNRKLRLRRVAVERLGKIPTNKDVSWETSVSCTLVFTDNLIWYQSWPVKKADGEKKRFLSNTSLEYSSVGTQVWQSDKRVGSRANGTWNCNGRQKWQSWGRATLYTSWEVKVI